MLISLVRAAFGVMMINFYATARTFGAVEKSTLRAAGITLALVFACAALELISGFVGALNWEEPLHAKKCAVWGAAALATGLAGNAAQAMTGYGVSYVAWITGCIVPMIYLAASLHFCLVQRKR